MTPAPKVIAAIVQAAEWLNANNVRIPVRIVCGLYNATKTYAFYQRKIQELTRDLYRGDIDAAGFVDDMAALIENQLTRAWNEGMRNNGLDPAADMTPEWENELEKLILDEYDYVDSFAAAIQDSAANAPEDEPLRNLPGLYARGDVWANRYNEVVNYAMIVTRPEDRYKWVLGATEQHCATCAALNGVVATGSQWLESGIQPQSPPNDMLECGGWRCDCALEYTEDPITPGGIPNT